VRLASLGGWGGFRLRGDLVIKKLVVAFFILVLVACGGNVGEDLENFGIRVEVVDTGIVAAGMSVIFLDMQPTADFAVETAEDVFLLVSVMEGIAYSLYEERVIATAPIIAHNNMELFVKFEQNGLLELYNESIFAMWENSPMQGNIEAYNQALAAGRLRMEDYVQSGHFDWVGELGLAIEFSAGQAIITFLTDASGLNLDDVGRFDALYDEIMGILILPPVVDSALVVELLALR